MANYELSGEPNWKAFPAAVEITEFHGVEITRLSGPQSAIEESTRLLEAFYSTSDMRTFSDAKLSGYMGIIEIYDLIVLRKL